MKKICVFTQTYSDNREKLFYYHCNDKSDIDFRNNFDLNLYSFHNCSDQYVSKILNLSYFKNLKNLKIIRYNDISYTQSIKETLKYIYKQKYDCLIFLQDDCLSKTDMNKHLINFIKNKDFDMLNLENTPEDLKSNAEIFYENENLKIYNTTSLDYYKSGKYSFDDGGYVANLKFILTHIYDSEYLSKENVWDGEIYLNNKIEKNPIQRLTTNYNFYLRYNILGRNSLNSKNDFIELQKRFENYK